MSHASRWDYFKAIYGRYRRADRKSRQTMLDEFCTVTRYHRKYALRLLNGPPPERRRRPGGLAQMCVREDRMNWLIERNQLGK
jgi:hypothetical protein